MYVSVCMCVRYMCHNLLYEASHQSTARARKGFLPVCLPAAGCGRTHFLTMCIVSTTYFQSHYEEYKFRLHPLPPHAPSISILIAQNKQKNGRNSPQRHQEKTGHHFGTVTPFGDLNKIMPTVYDDGFGTVTPFGDLNKIMPTVYDDGLLFIVR